MMPCYSRWRPLLNSPSSTPCHADLITSGCARPSGLITWFVPVLPTCENWGSTQPRLRLGIRHQSIAGRPYIIASPTAITRASRRSHWIAATFAWPVVLRAVRTERRNDEAATIFGVARELMLYKLPGV